MREQNGYITILMMCSLVVRPKFKCSCNCQTTRKELKRTPSSCISKVTVWAYVNYYNPLCAYVNCYCAIYLIRWQCRVLRCCHCGAFELVRYRTTMTYCCSNTNHIIIMDNDTHNLTILMKVIPDFTNNPIDKLTNKATYNTDDD